MDFGRPNAEIGRKMANGLLLFLALQYMYRHYHIDELSSEQYVPVYRGNETSQPPSEDLSSADISSLNLCSVPLNLSCFS